MYICINVNSNVDKLSANGQKFTNQFVYTCGEISFICFSIKNVHQWIGWCVSGFLSITCYNVHNWRSNSILKYKILFIKNIHSGIAKLYSFIFFENMVDLYFSCKSHTNPRASHKYDNVVSRLLLLIQKRHIWLVAPLSF
jgi:hypothetical protein